MDISPQNDIRQPISDDQDLAKALAGISPDEPIKGESFNEELPELPGVPSIPGATYPDPSRTTEEKPAEESLLPGLPQPSEIPQPELPVLPGATTGSTPLPGTETPAPDATSLNSDSLDGIKKDALQELRPLVDKVDLSPEERFEVYVLLLRSTDDKTLIEPAYRAAQGISDEKRKAQALLDIIKEIDYLSQK